MKKILIIGLTLDVGGAEKSLVNFLNLMDRDEYIVDLLLFKKQGIFLNQIPNWVNVIEVPAITILFQPMKKTISSTGVTFKEIILSIKRYFCTGVERIKHKSFDSVRIHRWVDYYQSLIPLNTESYDIGIAYAGGESTYYLVDKTTCSRKVCFFHNDYSKINIDKNLEEIYMNSVDRIITISETCKNSLSDIFPKQIEKVSVLQNLSSPRLINKLSLDFYPDEYKKNENKTIIVSVGRLNNVKGYDIAIRAAKILKDNEIKFIWYVIGEGKERNNLERDIKKYKLQEEFVLLGLRENPYPYIRNATILVQPSRFEGKSVVLDEAKILNKPIVVTNYSTAEDQIEDEKSGLIAEMTPEGLEKNIYRVLSDENLYESIVNYLTNIDDASTTGVDNYCKVLVGE